MNVLDVINTFLQQTCSLPDKSMGFFKRAAIILGLVVFHTLTLGIVALIYTVKNHSCFSKIVKSFDWLIGKVFRFCRKDKLELQINSLLLQEEHASENDLEQNDNF